MKDASNPYFPGPGRIQGLWEGTPASAKHLPDTKKAGISTVKGKGSAPAHKAPVQQKLPKKRAAQSSAPATLAHVLQQTAKRMLPFYRKIAANAVYARRWSKAVVDTDLDEMERLLRQANPNIGRNFPGSNGIGYFIEFHYAEPFRGYTNGTTIPPGTVQFVFEPQAHRAVAAAVIPFYSALAGNRRYAQSVAKAVQEDDPEALSALVRSKVKSKSLRTVGIESTGVALNFRFAFSKYPYRNLLIKDETA